MEPRVGCRGWRDASIYIRRKKKKEINNMSRNYLNRNSLSSDTTNIHNNSKLAYYLTHALLKNFKLQIIVTLLCVK